MDKKIQRIDTYNDDRFDKEILLQHGAFIVGGKYKACFRIINSDSAILTFDLGIDVSELIDEFRFYSGHITNFYDEDMALIKSFAAIEIFEMNIRNIQPSQFLVDIEKVNAIESFIKCENDICISVAQIGKDLVSRDGHTRLYYAITKGFSKVKVYLTEPGEYLDEFVEEARKRNVYSPYDLKLVSHKDYRKCWDEFCDDFFEEREKEQIVEKRSLV